MLPTFTRCHVEKIYCERGIEFCTHIPTQPAVQIEESITSFEGPRNVEICLCGDGKTETEVHFLKSENHDDLIDCWDPCCEESFTRKESTPLGIFNVNLYVYEGPGYGFGDQPLREANVFFLQYDRGQQSSLQRALGFAKRIKRVREDYKNKSLFVLASNGFDYTKADDNWWALFPHEAELRNALLNLLNEDSNLVSLLLSFSNIFFLQNDAEAVSREAGMSAADSIGASYLELNAFTGRGVPEAFTTCLNLYINETAEAFVLKKQTMKKLATSSYTKAMFKRCVKVAKKNLEKRFSIF